MYLKRCTGGYFIFSAEGVVDAIIHSETRGCLLVVPPFAFATGGDGCTHVLEFEVIPTSRPFPGLCPGCFSGALIVTWT